ncbi:MAG: protein-L-isoaspartate(D-aspartate) O-methyltransferase, partial [Verrucomicrobiota bacterium]
MQNGSIIVAVITSSIALGFSQDATGEEQYKKERNKMVKQQIVNRGITDTNVVEAMRSVPRHQMIPPKYRRDPYGDHPAPIGYGQTISQPYIVAYMTRQLKVEPGEKVLEIGTGSGYQAAVLAEITTNVYTIEIVPELAKWAKKALPEAGYDNVTVRHGDGYHGWAEKGPWDAIVVTAAADHIPPPLVQQLAERGKMCIPVGSRFSTQYLLLVQKDEEGEA